MSHPSKVVIDYTDPDIWQDPHTFYGALRDQSPVHLANDVDGTPLYIVTRFKEVKTALTDSRFSKDPAVAEELGMLDLVSLDKDGIANGVYIKRSGGAIIRSHLLNSDPPTHSRLRAALGGTFSSGRIRMLSGGIQQLIDDQIEQIDPNSDLDLIDDVIAPVVVGVICQILGVPSALTSKIREWSAAIAFAPSNEAEAKRGKTAVLELRSYFVEKIKELRPTIRSDIPADDQPDLVHALMAYQVEDKSLSMDELLGMIELALIAGHETTIGLMSNGILALMDHPKQFDLLLKSPELLMPAIEEMLRYEGPVYHATFRITAEEVELGGLTIPKGAYVSLMLGTANRDERLASDPSTFDISRPKKGNLAFGRGVHFCLGAPLARKEAEIILGTLFQRFPQMRLARPRSEIKWEWPAFGRTLHGLPMRLNP